MTAWVTGDVLSCNRDKVIVLGCNRDLQIQSVGVQNNHAV